MKLFHRTHRMRHGGAKLDPAHWTATFTCTRCGRKIRVPAEPYGDNVWRWEPPVGWKWE